ncbi:MAG: dipeptide epimerase, partial [Acidobacteria bacterium]|nr:dipeptide epimerase [Acidobacteriota bacterium]
MNRRDWMRTFGAAAALPLPARTAAAGVSFETEIKRWKLRHTWTTVMSSSDHRDNLYVRFRSGGITGIGEGAPIVRYKENAVAARAAAESVRDLLVGADP